MLLARHGLDVLVVDRATFPSDAFSTHAITAAGMVQLRKWGVADQLWDKGTPPLPVGTLGLRDMALSQDREAGQPLAAPRRTVLDKLLLDNAAEAGATVREATTVKALLRDGERVTGIVAEGADGEPVEERARVVIGADGQHSFVARAVDAPATEEEPSHTCGGYAYFSGVGTNAMEIHFAEKRVAGIFPTNDDQACIFFERPIGDFPMVREDVESAFFASLADISPALEERVRGGERTSRFRCGSDVPAFYRKPYGPGWALVGDAGFHKDPVTGHGITDAFRDAELVSTAVVEGTDEAMADYEQRRHELSHEVFLITQQLARMEWTEDELVPLFLQNLAAVEKEAAELSSLG